eukprot:1152973-Pelagomonas_calceolata.AAC.8
MVRAALSAEFQIYNKAFFVVSPYNKRNKAEQKVLLDWLQCGAQLIDQHKNAVHPNWGVARSPLIKLREIIVRTANNQTKKLNKKQANELMLTHRHEHDGHFPAKGINKGYIG